MSNQILFYISLIFVLFLPGTSLLLAIFGKSKTLNVLERFIASFALSIVSMDFIFFAFSKADIPITRLSSFIGIALFTLACLAIYKFRKNFPPSGENAEKLFSFSKNQFILILLLVFMTIFLKTAYLTETVFPTSTDMGHHMYWTQWLIENNALPTYDGMPDFIIGEHIIFGIIGLLSGESVFSAFPIVVLLLVNLFGILTVFILTLRIFQNKNIAILTLLFLGVLYAVSSPQAKFVSGGVIGNILGNLLMPMAFYLYCRALSVLDEKVLEKKSAVLRESRIFLALAFFMTFGLFYTHHLTGFIFLFIWALLVATFFALHFKNLKTILSNLVSIILSPQVLGTFFVGLVFFFFVFTPTYIAGSAVGTAVGTPSKETRAGLTMDNLKSSIGEARLALGLLGIILLAFLLKKKSFGHLLIFSWASMIFIMSFAPQILFINLPSNRIGNYLSYPFAILSAFVLYFIFRQKEGDGRSIRSNNFLKIAFVIILAFVLIDGMRDSASSFKGSSELSPLAQTLNASSYLKKNTTVEDMVIKDHNYITADAWIKIFLMRDYKYPLSRGFFKRYEDVTKPREMCTLHMISTPASQEAEACFSETRTNFIAVNPIYDSAQFKKLENFDQIYSNPGVNIYYKK